MKTEIRPLWKDILAAIWLGMVIPGIILHASVLIQRNLLQSQQEIPTETKSTSRYVTLRRMDSGVPETLDIQVYLTGVLLAEMPASFEEEALKAQSVAARTYTMKACTTGGKHGDGSVCDDSGCCQGFISETEFLTRGGTSESLDKVRKAVADTVSLVLMYDGELIEAVYFSSSGGKTESALAVWGADFPYLQSVDSPEDAAVAYQNKVRSLSIEEFQTCLGISLADEPHLWFSDITYTEGGGVECMMIADKEFSGIQLRKLLNLPSTAFRLSTDGQIISVISNGYGHRVGMSQYGANAMALAGSSFAEILAHYYPGTTVIFME